tara:strand:- start:835 stop:1632 length:798 start_codon:yes stop_codon:yes gene_type:complete
MTTPQTMKHHEYANLFPMLSDTELKSLAEDIRTNGLETPITTHEGAILDGRNRNRACEIAGVEPQFVTFDGEDALAFVISHNLHRRHLTESQRAMVAAKLATMRVGNPKFGSPIPPIGEIGLPHKDRAQAAKDLNIGASSLDRARRVQRDGVPELNEAVEKGEASVNAAAEVSKLPEAEQREAVSKGAKGIKEAAKKHSAASSSSSAPSPESQHGRVPKWEPNDADRLWLMAKQEVGKILPSDKSRVRVLNEMISYAQTRIEINK